MGPWSLMQQRSCTYVQLTAKNPVNAALLPSWPALSKQGERIFKLRPPPFVIQPTLPPWYIGGYNDDYTFARHIHK